MQLLLPLTLCRKLSTFNLFVQYNKIHTRSFFRNCNTMTSPKRFIIDCDVGCDDAQALILALGQNDVTIEGITAVRGNCYVDQVCKNIRKVLKLCNRLDIPTYKGCHEPLIINDREDFVAYHGVDGLGDVENLNVTSDDVIQSEHAVNYLVNAVRKEPKQITLICLGPLTNVAMALKLDPDFGQNLESCFIMGGNYHARGNVTTTAEFNFHFDPEAAQIVLHSLRCPTTVVGWEVCLDHPLTWAEMEELYKGEGRARTFIRVCESKGVDWMKSVFSDYLFADQLPMALALDPSLKVQSFSAKASVELQGSMTRGQMIVDRQAKSPNVEVVVKVHGGGVIEMMKNALDTFD